MRKERIAYCGVNCSNCPAYVATLKGQENVRIKIAALWSDKENQYDACEISCKGCHEPWGKKFRHCAECKVRACARKKLIATCAECSEYPCNQLKELLETLNNKIVRANLDELRCNNKAG
ncbi:hypothetical protein BZG02_13000 [Labilibaculum filiforme]|uniref:DUF3795 domain-containing protein n=1 Tax=Labilibaculum filiforme TaxID=1940526 RepID=A0A2N3HVY2_9BACT|nr:DUF3795 domain-containing protein [Labilibaculum filiforme]PKQ62230.1 hypothetical protein BZG02_13000 [Labilibaculum filiforme]